MVSFHWESVFLNPKGRESERCPTFSAIPHQSSPSCTITSSLSVFGDVRFPAWSCRHCCMMGYRRFVSRNLHAKWPASSFTVIKWFGSFHQRSPTYTSNEAALAEKGRALTNVPCSASDNGWTSAVIPPINFPTKCDTKVCAWISIQDHKADALDNAWHGMTSIQRKSILVLHSVKVVYLYCILTFIVSIRGQPNLPLWSEAHRKCSSFAAICGRTRMAYQASSVQLPKECFRLGVQESVMPSR